MKVAGSSVICFILLSASLSSQTNPPNHTWHVTNTDGTLESGWVVGFPTGSSDYFNERFDLSGPQRVVGTIIGSADFGSGLSYPQSGVFDPNFTVSSAGNTPDLASGFTTGPVPGGGAVFNYIFGSFGGVVTMSGTKHVVVQLPPGDSGLLGIGANSDNPDPATFSGWTNDGYASPANDFSATVDWGLGIPVICIPPPPPPPPPPVDVLMQNINLSDETGDFITVTVAAGGDYGWHLGALNTGALWAGFLSFAGIPIQKVTPILPTIPYAGGGAYFRAGSIWPSGSGGLTLNFVAVTGVPGVVGSVRLTNEVTLITGPDPACTWGIREDGTYETGWVVGIPTGSSDYFNNDFNVGANPSVNNVTDLQLAVMDFATSATSFPTTGVYNANLSVDSSGWTPDLSAGFRVAPMTFASGTFVSSSAQLVTRTFSPAIPYSSFADDNVHGVIQFPPGDSGLLGCGGDTAGTFNCTWGSAWTSDGYATLANRFDTTAGWGIRAGSN